MGFCPCVCKCQQLNEHKFLHCVLVGLSRQQFFFGIDQLLSVQEKKIPDLGSEMFGFVQFGGTGVNVFQ